MIAIESAAYFEKNRVEVFGRFQSTITKKRYYIIYKQQFNQEQRVILTFLLMFD